jgi:hypothetical protein
MRSPQTLNSIVRPRKTSSSNGVSSMGPIVLYVLAFAVALVFVAAALLQWLWNMTLPDIFGTKTVRYWQAFRLILIASILFGPGTFLNVTA